MSVGELPAAGIDLGTTFSVVAFLDAVGRPTTVANAEGDPTTPSVVLFDDDSIVVRKEALRAATSESDRVARFAERDMGSPAYSRPIPGEFIPPEVIQSPVLEKLRRDAAVKLCEFPKGIITVPAYFNEPRRRTTQDDGQLAGLEVLDIINEPTAAAIAFGVQPGFLTPEGEARHREAILIYDLGGGTFDVMLVEIDGGKYVALATAADVFLSGIDRDRRIVDRVAEQYKSRHRGIAPRDDPGGRGVRVPLSRQQLEDVTDDLLERTRFTVGSLLSEAKVAWTDIMRILLLEDPEYRRMSVRNVNSHDLGVLGVEPQTVSPRYNVMIPRNSPLPLSKTSRFKTHRPGQKCMAVKFIEGGDASGNDATPAAPTTTAKSSSRRSRSTTWTRQAKTNSTVSSSQGTATSGTTTRTTTRNDGP